MAVTLQQLADICGVSRGTVDRALHNKKGVRPDVAARIRETAHSMGYISPRTCPVVNDRTIRIGVVLHSYISSFVQILADIYRTYPAQVLLPVKTIVRTQDGMDAQHQLALIDELVETEQIDGLALMPIASSLIKDRINALTEQGIPVITFNTDIADCNRLAYVGQNGIDSGRAAAALMGMLLEGKGMILPIIGLRSGHYADTQRLNGFTDEMALLYPNIQLLPPACCFMDSALSERILLRELTENDHLNGVYVSTIGRAGVYRALEKANAVGRVHVIVHDLTPDNLEMIRKGVVDFAIGQDMKTQGTLPLRLLYQYLTKHQSPKQRIYYTNTDIKFRYNTMESENFLY